MVMMALRSIGNLRIAALIYRISIFVMNRLVLINHPYAMVQDPLIFVKVKMPALLILKTA